METRPDYKQHLIFCRELTRLGGNYYGFGTLWMPWERRGSFTSAINKLRWKHGLGQEDLAWQKLDSNNAELATDVVEKFFSTRWLWYHCAIIERDPSEKGAGAKENQARHFSRLLRGSMQLFGEDGQDKRFSFRCGLEHDPESAALVERVENRLMSRSETLERHFEFKVLGPSETLGLQVCDLLTGAVAASFGEDVRSEPQCAVSGSIAGCLGWDSLRGDTPAGEWKFNICSTREHNAGRYRLAPRRQVRHKYRVSGYRRSDKGNGSAL